MNHTNPTMTALRKVKIRPIMPASDSNEIDLEAIECIPQGPDCNVVDDSELGIDVIEVTGEKSSMIFPTNGCNSPYLVLHVKNISKFMGLDLMLLDSTRKLRTFKLSNRRSTAVIEPQRCDLPLDIGDGWQYLCLDLNDLLHRSYGTSLRVCREIVVCGSCRVSKIFFQDDLYADIELPPFLRVIS